MAQYRKKININTNSEYAYLKLNRHPVPFKCIITPRTPAAEALVRDSANKDY